MVHDYSLTRRHGHLKGAEFYYDALCYAQSQWVHGKPAQAILQLNKAWMADLAGDEGILKTQPSPYRALVWILVTAATGDHGYLGNPVRHFQHLASRMPRGPHAEIRAWRAWRCFHLAEKVLNRAEFPRDGEQIAREGLWIPSWQRVQNEISRKGWSGETPLNVEHRTLNIEHRREEKRSEEVWLVGLLGGGNSPISNLQSPISNLQSPISNLQSPISNLQSPISNLQSPISNLQSPIYNLQSTIYNPPHGHHRDPPPPHRHLHRRAG